MYVYMYVYLESGQLCDSLFKSISNATHLFFICAIVWPKDKATKLAIQICQRLSIYLSICTCVCVCATFLHCPKKKMLSSELVCQFHVRNYKLRVFPKWVFLLLLLVVTWCAWACVCACVRENSGIGELCEYICR